MFVFDPSFDAPLIPPHGQWPLFDELLVAAPPDPASTTTTPSPAAQPDPLPSTLDLAAMPIPPSRSSPRNKNPNHIPRPRNAFMLFRSAFAAARRISANIEHDNRHITRVIAHCWNSLPDADKQVWRDKAAAEKAQHAERYPNYRFSPVGRAKKPKKRKVRRNGVEDVKRCETLANLVMAGKHGRELERAMNAIEGARAFAQPPMGTELDVFTGDGTRLALDLDADDVPPFRSPLLPPAPQQVPDNNAMPHPLVITTAHHVEPLTFPSPTSTDASTSDDDLQSLFHTPPWNQYYQLDEHDSASPGTIPSTHYQSLLTFGESGDVSYAEPEQSTLCSWNLSDNYSYYH